MRNTIKSILIIIFSTPFLILNAPQTSFNFRPPDRRGEVNLEISGFIPGNAIAYSRCIYASSCCLFICLFVSFYTWLGIGQGSVWCSYHTLVEEHPLCIVIWCALILSGVGKRKKKGVE